MLFTVDIGNTNITCGLFDDDDNIAAFARVYTNRKRTADQYAVELKAVMKLKGVELSRLSGAVISSVVPELTFIVRDAVAMISGIEPIVLSPKTKHGLVIDIENPAQLGSDLIAGAVAAIKRYPLPCLIMDIGTATKISIVDSRGVFRGCTISAGVHISIEALSSSASQLPPINLDAPDCTTIGRNTTMSMQAGIILGTASMLDGLCDRIEEDLNEKVGSIVATGGLAKDITKHCRRKLICEPNLILYGLLDIHKTIKNNDTKRKELL